MDYRKIAEYIKSRIEKTHDREAYKDLLALCIGYEAEDFAAAHQLNSEVRRMTSEALRNGNPKDAEYFYTLHKQAMLFDAPHDFDTFLLYVEMDRKPEKRFYAPRRRYLRPIVQGYQDVLDGKLRLLTICNLGYEMQGGIGQLGKEMALAQNGTNMTIMQTGNSIQSQMAQCCCDTKRAIDGVNANIDAKFAALEKSQLEQRIAEQSARIASLEMDNRMYGVVRYPNGYTYNAGNSPFCGCNSCCGVNI